MGFFSKIFHAVRDPFEAAASLAGNYLLPGSSIITDHLVSKGAQNLLSSPVGQIAQVGTGLAGGGVGASLTGIPAASDIGAGWTNLANNAGNLAGIGNVGTNISNGLSSALSGVGDTISKGASAVGNATGLSNLLSGGSGSPLSGAGDYSSAYTPTSLTYGTSSANPITQQFSQALGGAAPASSSGFSALTGNGGFSAGIGGGGSSYNPIGIGAALLGGANSLSANDKAQKDLLAAQNKALSQLQPYQASGVAANSRLSDLLGTSGNTTSAAYGSLEKPFNPSDLQNDPGYQFQLQQGNQALDRKEAASGNYFSGGALKASQDYGHGLADTTFNNAFSRNLAQNQQTYGQLAGQSGQGANVAGGAAGINENTGTAKANAGISSSNILNSTLSSLLNGSGAKRLVGYGQNGQPLYA